ncbi:UreD-domain-containing protein [Rhodofomes roseus]|uniref:UreD-domain-containing protein n=1 Tax=Rhodofomes roseus TaxID=34475 RepID=A0ABQ8KI53_9APHY|nr:UreD-domain-containing protein [Rhodofomes roseus]KAH9837058.1 UreD-domain-containing protein [Rhodofomes roseus]
MDPGTGRIVLRKHGSEATFSELSYVYPLKLLSPRLSPQNANAVYVLTYGGGLVGGDRVELSVVVDAGAALVMLTQGSTKVFKNRPGHRLSARSQGTLSDAVTTQSLEVSVAREGALFLLPDPVTCFRSAAYNQVQIFRIDTSASLVLLDWVTSGRKSLGEEWAFSRYYSMNEVWICDRPLAKDVRKAKDARKEKDVRLVKDVMLLEEQEPVHSLPLRTLADSLAPYSCYATLIMCGPLVQSTLRSLSTEYAQVTVFKHASPPDLLWSFSVIGDGTACVVRVAGTETETVKDWLGERLAPFEGAMGPDLYHRAFG